MKIEELRLPAQPRGRVTVLLDDGTRLRLVASVAAEQGLYTGQELDEQDMKALRAAAGRASARERAVRIISASAVTKDDLYARLVHKGESEDDAADAVQWLTELRLLDDAQVAQQTVQRGVSRGYGRRRIEQMLYEKRVPKEYWQDALAQIPAMDGEIDRFLQQRLQGRDPDQKELKRTVDALARRGYGWPEIQAGLRRYSDVLEETGNISED